MNRRAFVRTGGLGVVGLGLGACASTRTAQPVAAPPTPSRPLVNLPLVQASWDRVIRTTVGLRPHRGAGFVLRAERLDNKTIIHNYGHGAAGMSLSWGTAYIAAELATGHDERRAAIVGCGVVGLTSARQLQRCGFEVTIYAMSVPPATTSNMSLAGFTPTSGLVSASRRPTMRIEPSIYLDAGTRRRSAPADRRRPHISFYLDAPTPQWHTAHQSWSSDRSAQPREFLRIGILTLPFTVRAGSGRMSGYSLAFPVDPLSGRTYNSASPFQIAAPGGSS